MKHNRRSIVTRASKKEIEQQEQELKRSLIQHIRGKEPIEDEESSKVSSSNIHLSKKKKKKPSPVQDENLILPHPIPKRLRTFRSHSSDSSGYSSHEYLDVLKSPSLQNVEDEPPKTILKKKKKKEQPLKINKPNNSHELQKDSTLLKWEPKKSKEHHKFTSELSKKMKEEIEEQSEDSPDINTSFPSSLLKYSSSKLRNQPPLKFHIPPLRTHPLLPFTPTPFETIAFDSEESFELEEERSRSPTPDTDEPSSTSKEEQKLYTCPFCVKSDFSETKLTKHIFKLHPVDKNIKSIVCPFCSTKPGGDQTFESSSFYGHLKLRHYNEREEIQKLVRNPVNFIFRPSDIITRTPKNIFLGNIGIGRAVDRSRDISDILWEYVLALDVTPSQESTTIINPPCDSCSGRIDSIIHTRAILGCGHSFHSDCVPQDVLPRCPICTKKEKKGRRKKRNKKSDAKPKVEL